MCSRLCRHRDDAERNGAGLARSPLSPAAVALRQAVQAHAAAAGMPDERARDVVIAVHELARGLVAVARRYGYRPEELMAIIERVSVDLP